MDPKLHRRRRLFPEISNHDLAKLILLALVVVDLHFAVLLLLGR
jgi:hypothetical protein